MSIDFRFANRLFREWWSNKFEEFGRLHIETIDISPETNDWLTVEETEELRKIGLSKKDFCELFLSPYQRMKQNSALNVDAIETIVKLQSKIIGHGLLSDTPIYIETRQGLINYGEALDWVALNFYDLFPAEINELDYKDLLDEPEFDYEVWECVDYESDLRQCRYCSTPDKDPRGKSFNGHLERCHIKGCNTTLNNPENHPDCCHGKWGLYKKSLTQALRRNHSNKDYLRTRYLQEFEAMFNRCLQLEHEPIYIKD